MLQGCPINRTIRNGCVALKNYRMGSGCDRVIEIEHSAWARVGKFGSPCMFHLVRQSKGWRQPDPVPVRRGCNLAAAQQRPPSGAVAGPMLPSGAGAEYFKIAKYQGHGDD